MAAAQTVRSYLSLTKPGIIMGNAVTAACGFVLASKGQFNIYLVATLLGLSLIIASACVFNNYIDRKADKKMARTQNRALAKGSISITSAILFGVVLGLLGILVLNKYTNFLTLFIAMSGFIVYVALYSAWKYRTSYGTLIGSIAGAVPPVVGYTAVTGRLDLGALLLFVIIVLWQMPHFFAIAIYRFSDYERAAIPVLPVIKGMHRTKVHMLLYVFAFAIAALLPTVFGFTGFAYLVVANSLGIIWLALCIQGFKCKNDKLWARKMFIYSLVVVTTLSVMISIDAV